MRFKELQESDKLNPMELIVQLTQQVSTRLCDTGTLVDSCDLATEELALLLHKNNIKGYIINGEFEYKGGEDNGWREGHWWIVLEDYPNVIIDPTRGQFDNGNVVNADMNQYHEFNIVKDF